MKNLILLLSLISSTLVYGQQSSTKTLIKTFNVKGFNLITADLEGKLNVQHWDNENLARVKMVITYQNANEHMMKYLIMKGRYNLQFSKEKDNLLYHPNYTKKLQINKKGDLLIEHISYTLILPRDVKLIDFEQDLEASVAEKDNK